MGKGIPALVLMSLLGGCHLLFPFEVSSSEDQGTTSDGQPPDHALDHKAPSDHALDHKAPPDHALDHKTPPDHALDHKAPPDKTPPDTTPSPCSTWPKWYCLSNPGCKATCGTLTLFCPSALNCTCSNMGGKTKNCTYAPNVGMTDCQIHCAAAFLSGCCSKL